MATVRVLLAQLAPRPRDPGANAETVVRLLEQHPDAELACFPELFLDGYDLDGIDRRACVPDDAALLMVRRAAATFSTAVVLGFAEPRGAGEQPADSALLVDTGGDVVATYRKVHLFGSEAEHFAAGHEYVVAPLLGLQVAPLICYDVEFPEPARAVALAGADLIVTIAANMAPYGMEHELFARSRAVENRCAHIYVNRVGHESGWDFVGGSCVVTPGGAVLASLGAQEQVAVVDLDLPALRPEPDYLSDRRATVRAVVVHPSRTSTSITRGEP